MAPLRRETVFVSQEMFNTMWTDEESEKVAEKDRRNQNYVNIIGGAKLIMKSWQQFEAIERSIFPALNSIVADRRLAQQNMFKTFEKQRLMLNSLLGRQIGNNPGGVSKDSPQNPSSKVNGVSPGRFHEKTAGKYNTNMFYGYNNANEFIFNKFGTDNRNIEPETVIDENLENVINSIDHLRQVFFGTNTKS